MKELFFTFLAISLPVIAVGGVLYLFIGGLYRLVEDWRLSHELRALRTDAVRRRQEQPTPSQPPFDPLVAFDDQPPPAESEGMATLPLDPDWPRPAPPATDGVTPKSHDPPADPGVRPEPTEVLSEEMADAGEAPAVKDAAATAPAGDEGEPTLDRDADASDPAEQLSVDEPHPDRPAQSESDDWPNRTLD